MRMVFVLLLISLVLSCLKDEPVWCDAILLLTVQNNSYKVINCSYEPVSEHNKWKDSSTIIQNTTKNSIKLKNRIFAINSMSSYTDTILYFYFQSDGPCARGSVNASTSRIALVMNSDEIKKHFIYPWNPDIFHEDICNGCENINYDTIVIK